LALGNNRGQVRIDGRTRIEDDAGVEEFAGGLLAQRSNIGEYTTDEFAIVPELGVTLAYELNPWWRITCGYTFLYWSRLVRAGDQIDLDLNPDLLPPEQDPFTGPLRPAFEFVHTDLWAQGLHLGLEGRW
jgi:hypothetical protein